MTLYAQTHHANKPRFFIIEGNIGAGKSTFISLVQRYLDLNIVYEPHEQWQNVGGQHNLLEQFYADMPRWAYTFQSYAFVTRIMAQEEQALKSKHSVHVLERSVFSDRYCFAKNLFEMGAMNALEWKLYQEWFSWLVENYMTKPSGFIYLRTDPEICYQRLTKRNRHEEAAVPLEYLKKIHDKHEDWLIKKEDIASYLKEMPVLVLDCNIEFENNVRETEKHMAAIVQFFDVQFGVMVQRNIQTSLSL